jgi:hypothetical protein
MPKDEEEDEPEVKYTPGGFFTETGLLFEQVKDGKFVMWNIDNEITTKDTVFYGLKYMPLPKVPWPLCKELLPYGDRESLWRDVKQFIWDHVFLPDEALYDVLTAWVFASWLPEIWPVVPYIFFFGPVASGKTRALEVLQRLCYRGLLSSNISSAALFRACEEWHPTLILDETEIYSKSERIEVIGLLNSGYRRGQFAIRAKSTAEGVVLEAFDVFGFKALAGTGGLAAALESRSIMVRMLKNRRKVRLFVDEARAEELRSKLLMWRMEKLRFEHTEKQDWIRHINEGPERDLCDLCDLFLREVPPLKIDSGRTQELFQCLLAVANEGRENIVKYAEKTEEMRHFEEKASIEAELVEILLNSNLSMENNIVLTKALAEAFNQSRSEREKWKSSSIGRIMRRLGFDRRSTRLGKGWYVDPDRIRYLKEIYLGGEGTPEKGSHRSQRSQPSSKEVLEFVRARFVQGTREEWVGFAVEAGLSEKDAEALFESLKGEDLYCFDFGSQTLWRWAR